MKKHFQAPGNKQADENRTQRYVLYSYVRGRAEDTGVAVIWTAQANMKRCGLPSAVLVQRFFFLRVSIKRIGRRKKLRHLLFLTPRRRYFF